MRNLDNNRVGNFNAPSHNYPLKQYLFKKHNEKNQHVVSPLRVRFFY